MVMDVSLPLIVQTNNKRLHRQAMIILVEIHQLYKIVTDHYNYIAGSVVLHLFLGIRRRARGTRAHGTGRTLDPRGTLKALDSLKAGVSLVALDTGLFLVFEVHVLDGQDDGGNNKARQNKTKDGKGDNLERDFFDESG